MSRAHQPGEHVFDVVRPEDIQWNSFAAFPPTARLAVLIGDPRQEGPYVIRVKLPAGERLMPHRHPEDRVYTVMSGVFYVGLGERFDGERVRPYPPGTVLVLPGGTWHFHWAKSGDYVTQVSATGPLGLEYHDAANDPRIAAAPDSNAASQPLPRHRTQSADPTNVTGVSTVNLHGVDGEWDDRIGAAGWRTGRVTG